MKPLAISQFTVTTACGGGKAALLDALRNGTSGLRRSGFDGSALDCWIGKIDALESPAAALPAAEAAWECRANRLVAAALREDGFSDAVAALRERLGAERIGVFVGTSAAGLHRAELAYRQGAAAPGGVPAPFDYEHTQNMNSCAAFVRRRLGLHGCAATVSAACASSAKAFAAAARAIRMGLCDAAVVGGVDALCLTTLYGFNALQLISVDICRPADARRNGISIGEACGFAILLPQGPPGAPVLLGYGESGDAHHMSAPEPDGRGAREAMRAALHSAALAPAAVDYINLHGTGTAANDLAEDRAVCAVFGSATACSSTKGWTGHTLGAAGMVEAAVSLLCIEHGIVPRSLNTRERDPQLHAAVQLQTRSAPVACVLSNSFGFGGNNCSLLFGAAQ
ncbi:MAG: beta-ketoacyl-ACP synthase [Nevskia sp.]|nr:beta-ketoacyl-ACP synthase [Nevskia sp.]